VLDDLAHADLCQLLRYQFFIKDASFDSGLVLDEGSNHLVQILAADARCFLTLGFDQSFDLNLELTRLFVEANIASIRIITAFAIVEAFNRSAVRILGREVETRCKHLLHKKTGSDRIDFEAEDLTRSDLFDAPERSRLIVVSLFPKA